jgi:hypothetical protein
MIIRLDDRGTNQMLQNFFFNLWQLITSLIDTNLMERQVYKSNFAVIVLVLHVQTNQTAKSDVWMSLNVLKLKKNKIMKNIAWRFKCFKLGRNHSKHMKIKQDSSFIGKASPANTTSDCAAHPR